jgi:CBS domain-containing protein
LEDALMDSKYTAREFMVENPVCASLWEPVSFIRQRMLLNSFSFLPVLNCGQWGFICETSLARYLRRPIEASDPTNGRKERLAVSLREAIASGQMELDSSEVCIPSTPIDEIVGKLNGSPILVVQEGDPTRLLGILTAYDLL